MVNIRTIQEVLSLESGEHFDAEELFKDPKDREAEIFQLRTKIEEQLQKVKVEYVCLYCKQPVAIRGRKNKYDHTPALLFYASI